MSIHSLMEIFFSGKFMNIYMLNFANLPPTTVAISERKPWG